MIDMNRKLLQEDLFEFNEHVPSVMDQVNVPKLHVLLVEVQE
jgi:hypothetical protein